MKTSYTFFLSANNLRRRKLRSVLTIGGMAVGIALIVFLVSLGFGLQVLVRDQITNVEALTILDVSKGESTLLKLDQSTVDSFQQLDDVQDVSPSLSLSGQVIYGETLTDLAIYGVNPQFLSMEGVKVETGGEFSGSESPEMIISATALGLIGAGDPESVIGKELTLKMLVPLTNEETKEEELVTKEVTMAVVGTVTSKEELSIGYVPLDFLVELGFKPDYSVAKVKVGEEGNKEYDMARIKVTDESKLPEVRQQIESMGYQVDSVADTVGQIDQIFLVFQAIVSVFGVIAMFVAALGALNTLTVSLLERTREIGLMKSLGATSGDIYRLFLMEAIVIGMAGGVVGIVLGYGAGEGVNAVINYLAGRLGGDPVDLFYTPTYFIGIVLLLVLFVSLFTGFYPARRAGKINPLVALRYE